MSLIIWTTFKVYSYCSSRLHNTHWPIHVNSFPFFIHFFTVRSSQSLSFSLISFYSHWCFVIKSIISLFVQFYLFSIIFIIFTLSHRGNISLVYDVKCFIYFSTVSVLFHTLSLSLFPFVWPFFTLSALLSSASFFCVLNACIWACNEMM